MYSPELDINDDEEIRDAIEKGRKYKIAAEVWQEFLMNRREEIIRDFESGLFCRGDDFIEKLMELQVMKKYRDMSQMMIDLGEIAERKMSENGE